jgi:hypothetical protein
MPVIRNDLIEGSDLLQITSRSTLKASKVLKGEIPLKD